VDIGLHRHLFAKNPAQAALFGGPVAPSVICRSSQAKERVGFHYKFLFLETLTIETGISNRTNRRPLLPLAPAIST
jgi:hypothetical protein